MPKTAGSQKVMVKPKESENGSTPRMQSRRLSMNLSPSSLTAARTRDGDAEGGRVLPKVTVTVEGTDGGTL